MYLGFAITDISAQASDRRLWFLCFTIQPTECKSYDERPTYLFSSLVSVLRQTHRLTWTNTTKMIPQLARTVGTTVK